MRVGDTKDRCSSVQSFQGWELDQEFAAKLDEGWNLEKVRDAAYKALKAAGKERMHFRPPDEQNEHKVTCGVRVDVIEKVKLAQSFKDCSAASGPAVCIFCEFTSPPPLPPHPMCTYCQPIDCQTSLSPCCCSRGKYTEDGKKLWGNNRCWCQEERWRGVFLWLTC